MTPMKSSSLPLAPSVATSGPHGRSILESTTSESSGSGVGAYRLHLDTETGDDDYGDSFEGATRVSLPSKTEGRLEDMNRNPLCCPRDSDSFWFQVAVAGTVKMWTTGAAGTYGHLYDSDEVWIASSETTISGNFRIARTLDPGIYYLIVSVRDLAHNRSDRTVHPPSRH